MRYETAIGDAHLSQETCDTESDFAVSSLLDKLRQSESERLALLGLINDFRLSNRLIAQGTALECATCETITTDVEQLRKLLVDFNESLFDGSARQRDEVTSLKMVRAELESRLSETQAALETHQEMLREVFSSRRWRFISRITR